MWKGDFDFTEGTGYIAAQLAGAACGSAILLGLVHVMDGGWLAADTVSFGTPSLTPGLDTLGGFLFEMIFGFILVFVILRTAVEDKHSWAPFAIGMTVFVLALVGGPLTGAAMNPARWFGPALISGTWHNAWIYILAPMAGALVAVMANEVTSRKNDR
jgi:glycerol uptake facilitator-like aquaporin